MRQLTILSLAMFLAAPASAATWNLDAGHVHGLDLKGDLRIEMERGVEVDAGGQEIAVDLVLELEGELGVSLTVE